MSNSLTISVSTKTLSTFKRQAHNMERKNNSSAVAWVCLAILWGWHWKGQGTLSSLFTSTLVKHRPLLHWSFFTWDLFKLVLRIKKENHWWKTNGIKKHFLHRFDSSDARCLRLTFHTDSILANRKKLFRQNILRQAILESINLYYECNDGKGMLEQKYMLFILKLHFKRNTRLRIGCVFYETRKVLLQL